MITKIKKRDGRIENYDSQKIINAIHSAMKDCGIDDLPIARKIEENIFNRNLNIPGVELIQDLVEKELMNTKYKEVAKTYILYRNKRTIERDRTSKLRKEILNAINCTDIKNQNANVDEYSFGGRKFESSAIIHKDIALNDLMSSDVAEAHKEHRIYIHDLDSYSVGCHNCLFANLEPLLNKGFITRNGDVRPASGFNTACQLVAVIFQAQSQCQFGGVASAHIDRDLAPFVKKSFFKHFKDGLKWVEGVEPKEKMAGTMSIEDVTYKKYPKAYEYAIEMLEKEGIQSAEALYHNLNTLESRPGSQLKWWLAL